MEPHKTHNLRNMISIKFNITLTLPDNINVKLDSLLGSFMDINIGKFERNLSEIKLDKVNTGKRTRER